MNIENLLKYQKVDAKLIQAEKQLQASANKKQCDMLSAKAKESQVASVELEKQAEQLSKEVAELKKYADLNRIKIEELTKKSIQNLTQDDILEANAQKEKLASNLNAMEKKVTHLAAKVKNSLLEFNKASHFYNGCKSKYQEFKKAFDEESLANAVVIADLKKELTTLEKSVDKDLLDKYKKKRNDRIFPVIVKLNDKSCGGCHMEIPTSQISKINQDGMMICENCRRIIYKA